jgi:hypothetical protein
MCFETLCPITVPGVSYETVRDLVLARMKDDRFEPPGMAQVLDQIVADRFPYRQA